MAPQTELEQDELAILEVRVSQAVELVQLLRLELEEAKSEADQLRQKLASIESDKETLQTERKEVRGRIEKLLGQMDLLSSEA